MTNFVVNIKPLSVNKCWQGRRFKTKEYSAYEEALLKLLPEYVEIQEGKLEITLVWGVSNNASDFDNPTKPFIDVLQKKYGFNDSRIHFSQVGKVIVPKGFEFVWCEISPLSKSATSTLSYVLSQALGDTDGE